MWPQKFWNVLTRPVDLRYNGAILQEGCILCRTFRFGKAAKGDDQLYKMLGFCRPARQNTYFVSQWSHKWRNWRLIGQPRLAAENEAECVAREVCGTPAGRGINPFFPGEFRYFVRRPGKFSDFH